MIALMSRIRYLESSVTLVSLRMKFFRYALVKVPVEMKSKGQP